MNKVAIVGAGPAGLSCALWLKNLAFLPFLIERATTPAEVVARHFHPNNWLLGFGNIPGAEIRARMVAHIAQQEIAVMTATRLTRVSRQQSGFLLECGQTRLQAAYLVIASGASPTCPAALRTLSEQHPDVVQIGPDRPDYLSLHGKQVAILGGGDNAFEHAIMLAEQNNQVALYCRGTPRARADFLSAAQSHPRIRVYTDCACAGFAVTHRKINFDAAGAHQQADYLMVMYGYTPNTQWIRDTAPWMTPLLNADGFIATDPQQRTTLPYIYAIGDVTEFAVPCIPVALAQGAVAAKSIQADSRTRHD